LFFFHVTKQVDLALTGKCRPLPLLDASFFFFFGFFFLSQYGPGTSIWSKRPANRLPSPPPLPKTAGQKFYPFFFFFSHFSSHRRAFSPLPPENNWSETFKLPFPCRCRHCRRPSARGASVFFFFFSPPPPAGVGRSCHFRSFPHPRTWQVRVGSPPPPPLKGPRDPQVSSQGLRGI